MSRPVLILAAALLAFLAGRYFPANAPEASGSRQISAASDKPASPALRAVGTALAHEAKVPAAAPSSGTPPAMNPAADKLMAALEKLAGSRDPSATEKVLLEWMAADPDAVVAFLSTSPQRDALLRKLATLWATADPAAASAWLATHGTVPGRDALAAGLSAAVVKEDHRAAIQWVASIADPAIKISAAQETGYEFYRQSDTAAQEALAGMGLPGSATEPVLSAWNVKLTAFARRSAQSLASVYAAAQAAGANMDAPSVADIRAIMSSGVNGSGQFATSIFQMETSGQTERETTAAAGLLELSGSGLQYKGD